MDAVKEFFRKYDAVPATDSGPSWSAATDEALWEWQLTYRWLVGSGTHRPATFGGPVREATPQERAAATPVYNEIRAEIKRRGDRDGRDATPRVAAMYLAEFGRLPG